MTFKRTQQQASATEPPDRPSTFRYTHKPVSPSQARINATINALLGLGVMTLFMMAIQILFWFIFLITGQRQSMSITTWILLLILIVTWFVVYTSIAQDRNDRWRREYGETERGTSADFGGNINSILFALLVLGACTLFLLVIQILFWIVYLIKGQRRPISITTLILMFSFWFGVYKSWGSRHSAFIY